MNFFVIFWVGWLISFLGQLPLGTMSITATQIAVAESFSNAWKYTIGVTIIEIAYVRLTVSGVAWIVEHKLFFDILNWLTVVLFLVLGVITFVQALKQQGEKKPVLLNNKLNRFVLGLTMSALNPAQIPFWFIWSSYLIVNVGVLTPGFAQFNVFSAGCGLGTVTGLAVYMYGGNYLIVKMKTNTKILNIIMGVVFIIAALAQLYRIFFMKEQLPVT
jgi:threonine/homoserine/homoserine lactone efflux protein